MYYTFASTYGSGQYDRNNYNGTNATSTGSTGNGTGTNANGGGLSDTGIMIALVVGIAAAVLLAAMVVRIWKRPGRAAKSAGPTVSQ